MNEKQKTLKTRRERLPIQTIVIEVVSIVLGVLLALGVNEWRAQRSQQRQADAALVNISNELESNLQALILLHETNSATVAAMQNPDQADTDEERKFVPGMQLQETAWQTLLSTGVSNYVAYETILQLSRVYSMQGVYKQSGQMLTQAAMNTSGHAAVVDKDISNESFNKQFINYLEMIVMVESEVIKGYEQALQHLEQ